MLCQHLPSDNQIIALDQNKDVLEQLYQKHENVIIEVLDGTSVQLEKIALHIKRDKMNISALLHFNTHLGSLSGFQDTGCDEWDLAIQKNVTSIFQLDNQLLPILPKKDFLVCYHLDVDVENGSYWGPLGVAQAGLKHYIQHRAEEEKHIIFKGLYIPPLNCKERLHSHPGYHNHQLPSPDILWGSYKNIFNGADRKLFETLS